MRTGEFIHEIRFTDAELELLADMRSEEEKQVIGRLVLHHLQSLKKMPVKIKDFNHSRFLETFRSALNN